MGTSYGKTISGDWNCTEVCLLFLICHTYSIWIIHFFYFVHTIYMNEDELNNRNSLFNESVQQQKKLKTLKWPRSRINTSLLISFDKNLTLKSWWHDCICFLFKSLRGFHWRFLDNFILHWFLFRGFLLLKIKMHVIMHYYNSLTVKPKGH